MILLPLESRSLQKQEIRDGLFGKQYLGPVPLGQETQWNVRGLMKICLFLFGQGNSFVYDPSAANE